MQAFLHGFQTTDKTVKHLPSTPILAWLPKMTQQNSYELLVKGNDRSLRVALPLWRAAQMLRMQVALVQPGLDIRVLANSMHQMSLMAVFEGATETARQICHAQIYFWRNLAQASSNPSLLGYVIQPWINLARLERQQQTDGTARSLYQDFAPENRQQPSVLMQHFGIAQSLDELCKLHPEIDCTGVLENVYWREYGLFLLKTGEYSALQGLLERGLSCQKCPFVKMALFEMQALLHARMGQPEAGLQLVNSAIGQADQPYHLHLKSLQLHLAHQAGSEAAQTLGEELCALLLSKQPMLANPQNLYLLHGLTRNFMHQGMDQQAAALTPQVAAMAQQLKDETVQFDLAQRAVALGQMSQDQLKQKFKNSSYAYIRKHLGLPLQSTGLPVLEAIQNLAELNYATCRSLLETGQRYALAA